MRSLTTKRFVVYSQPFGLRDFEKVTCKRAFFRLLELRFRLLRSASWNRLVLCPSLWLTTADLRFKYLGFEFALSEFLVAKQQNILFVIATSGIINLCINQVLWYRSYGVRSDLTGLRCSRWYELPNEWLVEARSFWMKGLSKGRFQLRFLLLLFIHHFAFVRYVMHSISFT